MPIRAGSLGRGRVKIELFSSEARAQKSLIVPFSQSSHQQLFFGDRNRPRSWKRNRPSTAAAIGSKKLCDQMQVPVASGASLPSRS